MKQTTRPSRPLALAEKGITAAEKRVATAKLAVKAAKVELKKAENSLDYWRGMYRDADAAIDAAKKEKANERSGNGGKNRERGAVGDAGTRHPWRAFRSGRTNGHQD